MAPRWRKVAGDLRQCRGRFLLALVAMAVGLVQITSLLYAWSILRGTLGTMYARTHPAAATLTTDSVDDALLDSLRAIPGVADVEARPVILARVRVGRDEWAPAFFYVVRDFRRVRLDTFEPRSGAWPPATGEALLDHTALAVARVAEGDSLVVRIAGAPDRAVRVGGTVHAEGIPPAWMEHMVPGFLPWDSPLRGVGESRQIRLRVVDDPLDEGVIRAVVDRVRERLEAGGHRVSWVNVPPPGRHPHADQMAAFLYLLGAFSLLSFALSCVLVAGMIQGLLAEQVRQIGIMKAIGASEAQVAGLYLAQVGLLAGGALILGFPPGLWLGRQLARFFAGILNGNVTNTAVPAWLLAVPLAFGLLLPLLMALLPIRRAAGITVHQALSTSGGSAAFGGRRLDRWLVALPGVPRALALPLRAAFLQRGRSLLTIGMLAVGGGMFIASLNVADGWTRAVDQDFARRHYELELGLPGPVSTARLDSVLTAVPGVARVEYWPGAVAFLAPGGRATSAHVEVLGPTPGSTLLELPLLAGRWLAAGDTEGVVINQALAARDTGLVVGASLPLRFGERRVAWPILGIVREINPSPTAYAPVALLTRAAGLPAGTTRTARLVLRRRDPAAQQAAATAVERALTAAGVQLRGIQRLEDRRGAILDHLVIVLSVLTVASLLVLVVGGIGLCSALTLSVVQRTREIGILGALGATPGTIARQIWAEALVMGLLSWGLALGAAAPLSWGLETTTGRIFFKSPLDFTMALAPALLWLGVVVVLASLSSLYPAWRAARLTVREALAHV